MEVRIQDYKSKLTVKRTCLPFDVFVTFICSVALSVLMLQTVSSAKENVSSSKEIVSVVEWDVVSPEEANIPKLSKTELSAKVERCFKAHYAFHSWEAKYRVMSRQAARASQDNSIPEMITTSKVHLISNGTRWFYESKKEAKYKTTNDNSSTNYRFASDGKLVTMLWPSDKTGQVREAGKSVGISDEPTIVNFLPSLPAESCLAYGGDFPNALEILNGSDTQLLPWYTRVGDHTCYVLEQIATRQHPLFRNKQELENWKKEYPEKAALWLKAKDGWVFLINPTAKASGIRTVKTTTRLAIDPQFGFAIVRWAQGYEIRSPRVHRTVFPYREITYGDFRKVARNVYIPWQMEYIRYGADSKGQERVVANQTQIVPEEFVVNKRYQPELFKPDIPKGYSVLDMDKGIVYKVGDSEQHIDALVAAAKAREDFYDKLRAKEAPALEHSRWINSKPIHLAEHKGRPIILFFWGFWCGPCMHELPWLQKQYARTTESSSGPLFISIHTFVDGDHLKQLKKVIKKHGITFPVMVDSPDTEGRSWGKTFKKYGIQAVPNEITIDENGHVGEKDKDIIHSNNFWMQNLKPNNFVAPKESETMQNSTNTK